MTDIKLPNGTMHVFIKFEKRIYLLKMDEAQHNNFNQIFSKLFTDPSMNTNKDKSVDIEPKIIGRIYTKFLKPDKNINIIEHLDDEVDYLEDDSIFLVAVLLNGNLQAVKLTKNQRDSVGNLLDLLYPSDKDGNVLLDTIDEAVGFLFKKE